jgi:hypothetical protein
MTPEIRHRPVDPPRIVRSRDPCAARRVWDEVQAREIAWSNSNSGGPRRPGDCSYAMSGKTRSLSLVSRLPGTSNWVLPVLQYTPSVWRSESPLSASAATPHMKLGDTPCVGAGSGLLGKHRKSRTEEDFVRLPMCRPISRLEDSLPHGSCAPQGDGALRRAGGAV